MRFMGLLLAVGLVLGCALGAPADSVIVKLRGIEAGTTAHMEARTALATELEGTEFEVNREYAFIPYVALEVSDEARERLEASALVEEIYKDDIAYAVIGSSVPHVGGDRAHQMGYVGTGRAVAIADSGTDGTHPALKGRIVAEACFSAKSDCPNGQKTMIGPGAAVPCTYSGSCDHGTHVAGIAAAGGTPVGMAPSADVVAIQIFSNTSIGRMGAYFSDVIAALEHALNLRSTVPIDSVNLSIGTGPQATPCDAKNLPVKDAFDAVRAGGIAPVVASGNNGSATGLSSPACLSNALSVGCTTLGDAVCDFSNSHAMLKTLAPGASINSTVPGGGWTKKSGTSMSTPHVTGAVALVRQHTPGLSVDSIVDLLRKGGKSVRDNRNGVTTPRLQIDAAIGNIGPPRCGDGSRNQPSEECDGQDDDACPGLCRDDCTCAGIGDCPDADLDGEPNKGDRCPQTKAGKPVDDSGCSIDQFCASVLPTSYGAGRLCRWLDWKNDKPIGKGEDCKVDKGPSKSWWKRADDRCVPK